MALVYVSVIISAAVWLYLIYRNDRFEPEPVKCVLLVGITGGLLSSIPAALLNTFFATSLGVMDALFSGQGAPAGKTAAFSLFVGFNEEILKALATVIILRKLKDFNEPIDALIYSMTVALGFAAFENVEYTLMGGVPALVIRSLTAVPLHIGLASIWGTGIARAKYFRNEKYFSTLIPYVCAAALIHALYDYIQFINVNNPLAVVIALLFALIVTVYASRRLKNYQKESPFAGKGVCPSCGAKNSFSSRFCKKCGASLDSEFFDICRNCGVKNRKGADFCRSCGRDMAE